MTTPNNTNKHSAPAILLVDPDYPFLKTLQADPASKQVPIIAVTNGGQAQLRLAERAQALLGVFINPNVASPSGISVVRASKFHRPVTPIYLLFDDGEAEKQLGAEQLRRLGVRKTLKKPLTYREILDLVAPLTLSFDAKSALDRAKTNQDALGSELDVGDSEFTAIHAENFMSGNQSLFDVYVQISKGKYLKLLQAGDVFTIDRLETYLKKGILYFYIKKEVQESYLKYCDHLTTTILKSAATPTALKLSQTLNHGQQTLEFLKNSGLSESSILYARKFVTNVREMVSSIKVDADDPIASLIADVASYDHSVGTAALGGLLAKALEINMDKPTQIVGMACLFHDIGLAQMPEVPANEDVSTMTEEQKKLFYTHPMKGAELLRGLRSLEEAALQAIEQHHMRLGGRGFPNAARAGTVGRVAEIVGICEEFNRLILAHPDFTRAQLLEQLEKLVFPGFSRQILYAFRSLFFPRPSG